MAYDFVPDGPYFGRTRTEIVALMKPVDDAIAANVAGVGSVTSASENGKSFTFSQTTAAGEDSFTALLRRKKLLTIALCYVDDDYATSTDRTTASFRC